MFKIKRVPKWVAVLTIPFIPIIIIVFCISVPFMGMYDMAKDFWESVVGVEVD